MERQRSGDEVIERRATAVKHGMDGGCVSPDEQVISDGDDDHTLSSLWQQIMCECCECGAR